ncbi:hypothetical protein BJ912DRAFT_930421 [Pholiota molesta]|nr:hypothetical protein BJ912DRAFT_930421 [Pholiota molesta]
MGKYSHTYFVGRVVVRGMSKHRGLLTDLVQIQRVSGIHNVTTSGSVERRNRPAGRSEAGLGKAQHIQSLVTGAKRPDKQRPRGRTRRHLAGISGGSYRRGIDGIVDINTVRREILYPAGTAVCTRALPKRRRNTSMRSSVPNPHTKGRFLDESPFEKSAYIYPLDGRWEATKLDYAFWIGNSKVYPKNPLADLRAYCDSHSRFSWLSGKVSALGQIQKLLKSRTRKSAVTSNDEDEE